MAGKRGRDQRVSTIFNLGRSQATLDFVNVDIRTDTTVFISPRALSQIESDWGDGCVSLIQNFFETVLGKIKAGEHGAAESLLNQLREPNETHLGLSSGRSRGRALGTGSAHDVWSALSQSEAAKSGLLKDLEDTVLLIRGIGVDVVSDITTNIIRGALIEYTQEQCRQLDIPLQDGLASGPLWHPARRQWFNTFVSLPITTQGKLLLVPKAIVRRSAFYDVQEYYRHYLLESMREEEIRVGSSLVYTLKDGTPRVNKSDLMDKFGKTKDSIVEQTFRFPDALEDYRREMANRPFLPLSHEELAGVEHSEEPNWDALLADVTSLPSGRDTASSYEKAIEALLTALLYPDLISPVYQERIHADRKRIDIKYTNMAVSGFFSWLAKHYAAPQVFIECKNYTGEVANPELDQLAGRFSPSRGQFGIIVCREIRDKALFGERCRDTAKDGRGYILSLDDADLRQLVEARKADSSNKRSWPLLMDRFQNLTK